MKRFLVLLLCLVLLPTLAFAQGANDTGKPLKHPFKGLGDAITTGTGSFSGGGMVMSPRYYRSGEPGDPCEEYSSGEFNYQLIPFRTDGSGTLTVGFDAGTCDTDAYVTFQTSFNPRNICEGYVWAEGSSSSFTNSFTVPPNTPMYMIVSTVSTAPRTCGPWEYALDGTAEAVPTLPQWGLIVFAGLLALTGAWVLRRRSRVRTV